MNRTGSQQTPGPPEALFRDMLRGARELLAIRDPLDAELLVSEFLGTWWGERLPEGDVEVVIGEALVDHATASGGPAALALLTGIAHLGSPAQAEKADTAAASLAANGVARPSWAQRIGQVSAGECFVSRDVYGDQDSVIATFHPPEPEARAHALVVLIDYNLGGMAKDAWCSAKVDTLLERCREQAAENPLMEFEGVEPARARAMLEAAVSETNNTADPPVSKSFPGYHAFVRARLATLPGGDPVPRPPHWSEDRKAALAVEFLASAEAETLSDTAAAGRCADLIIDHGCNADLGRPLRVSPIKSELFLLDWLPRKVMLSSEDRDAMPHVLAAWVRWCGRRSALPQEGIRETLDAVWEGSRRFEDTYGEPSKLGLDSGTVERLVPDGDLEALPRRAFAVPLLTGTVGGTDLGTLDPADPEDRRVLLAAEHPEYAALTQPGPPAASADEGSDPGMHLTMHEIVATQLWAGDPPETWNTARRLLDLGYERHDVLHMLVAAVQRTLYRATDDGHPFDIATFRSQLEELPQSWEDPR